MAGVNAGRSACNEVQQRLPHRRDGGGNGSSRVGGEMDAWVCADPSEDAAHSSVTLTSSKVKSRNWRGTVWAFRETESGCVGWGAIVGAGFAWGIG